MKALAEERSGLLCDSEDAEASATISAYRTPLLASSASLSRMSPLLSSELGPKGSPFSTAELLDEQIRAISTYDSIELLPDAHGTLPQSSSRYSGTGMVSEHGYPIARDWSMSSLRSQLQDTVASSPLAQRPVPQGGRLRKSSTFEAMINSGILSASMEAVGYLGTSEATLRISSADRRSPTPSPLTRSTPARSPTQRYTYTPASSPPSSSTATATGDVMLPSLPPLSATAASDQQEPSPERR
ncbi:hypothetical protein FGB62_66g115 [Gracilaria domingensis]|nr:hypothetical protein FGB62_66g115 [Gracilaria domingensis]